MAQKKTKSTHCKSYRGLEKWEAARLGATYARLDFKKGNGDNGV